ncbi:hypothetical protein C6503_03425 [Candidatus Poribacteria bacterium]|nr:MAG: hypothetical protein C6503_03425 [Candidatus Poribacteria bacterium]
MSIEELKRENAALKATNLKLQNQVRLMQTIFDSLSEGVVATLLDGEFLIANPVAREIAGMGPTGESPEKWDEIYGAFYPDKTTLVPSTELPLYKAMQGEVTNDVKLFIRNKNRPEGVFYNVSGRPLFDETGDVIGGVIAMRNITELERVTEQLQTTVEELRAQNELMNAIFNAISDGIIVADKEGRYTLFNERAGNVVGQEIGNIYTTEAPERLGLFQPDMQEVFPVDELPLVRALRGEKPNDVEIWVRNSQLPDGLDVNISARPIYDKNGAVSGGVAIIRDITAVKAAETQLIAINDQLMAQTQLFQSVFNNISDGVIVADETGRIIMANPYAMQVMGVSPDLPEVTMDFDEWREEYGFFYSDAVTPLPVDELPLMVAIQGKFVDDVEMFIKGPEVPDGIHISTSSRPLQDSDGNWAGGVAVFRDITDRIKREEALARAFAQGRLEIIDTILHNIGNAINSVAVGIDTIHHQLTNDQLTSRLNALANAIEHHQDNFSDYVKNDPQGQKVLPFILTLSDDYNVVSREWKQIVQRIRDRTRHIVDIIRTQDSYNITSGTRKDINLTAAISDALKILQDSIDRRDIHIEIDADTVPKEIRIQESQFHQTLVNIIKNAIEAIDALAESGEHSKIPRIQFRATINGDFFCLDVTDSGIGIAPEHMDKIFSAGFTTKAQGNGLGLHSSANFVIGSGGRIQALSEGKGKGTTIRIMFQCSSVYEHR